MRVRRRRMGHSRLSMFRRQQRLNLALEGGGAHGAFTWGVLDRLLEDETLDIAWISATSAGAVNAVALAAGLAEDGRAGARAKLRAVWEAVAKAGVPDLLRLNPWLAEHQPLQHAGAGGVAVLALRFQPAGLRSLPQAAGGPHRLRAAAHHARARAADRRHRRVDRPPAPVPPPRDHGARRCWPRPACRPCTTPSSIDGQAYWDGGFSANPDSLTLGAREPGRRHADRQAQPRSSATACRRARARSRRASTRSPSASRCCATSR